MDKPKTVKVVTLEARFPDVLVKHSFQSARGEGANIRIAAQRAIKTLLSAPGLRNRRLTSATITMSVGTRVEDDNVTDGVQEPTR